MLMKYEFLKILRRKSTVITMLASLIVTAFLFGLPAIQFVTYSQDGEIKGAAGIALEKQRYSEIAVPLTEEYTAEAIGEVQRLFADPDNVGYDGEEQFLVGDAYWNGVAPREKLLNLIAKNYSGPDESAGYNKLRDIDLENKAGFYQAREEKIAQLLENPSRGMTKEQKEYWSSMDREVEVPFSYGYHEGWEVILTSFELLMFALFAVCIAIAPVFSGEYQAGTDAVLLAGRYGKTKLITAKITASFLFGLLAFTLHIIVAFGMVLAAFGTEGWNLPLQTANTAIPYPFTFLQVTLVNLGVIYLILLAMISLTLLLSARMKTPYLVLLVLVPVLFIPIFVAPNGTTGVYNLTLFLLPYRASTPEVGKYISYQFGSLVLDTFAMRAIVYMVLAAVLLPFTRLSFKRHQAGV